MQPRPGLGVLQNELSVPVNVEPNVTFQASLALNSEAIRDSISTFFLFKLSANVAEETVRYIQGHEGDLLALRSLVTEPGQFSQCYMIQRRTQGTRRLILELTMPPLLYATTTTRPADKLEFEKLVGSGMTLTDALVEFAKRYPKGVKA